MARIIERLSDLKVRKLSEPGRYPDGGGLYLQISSVGTKAWVLQFMLMGKSREMGLGSLQLVSLAEARAAARDARKLCWQGIDPINARRGARAAAALEAAKAITFDQAAERYIAAHRAAWRNDKHAAQWQSTIDSYATPLFGSVSVQAVDTTLVMKALEPVWSTKPETASRVRGRVEAILNWAAVRGYRTGENPARWRGHLEKLLPQRTRVRKVKHHAALGYADVPEFLVALRAMSGTAARALEFTILTAARTGEVIGAQRAEIDTKSKVWTVPADRMKAGHEHRVPLAARALELALVRDGEQKGFVFPGRKAGMGISNMSMLKVLKLMKRDDVTVHGFRSSFRDWASEQTDHSPEVIEMALAHTIADKTEAAYRRGDLLAKRQKLMEDWAAYCVSPPVDKGKVVPFPSGRDVA